MLKLKKEGSLTPPFFCPFTGFDKIYYEYHIMNKEPILILGIGNILLRDEGVGVHVAEKMQRFYRDTPHTRTNTRRNPFKKNEKKDPSSLFEC